MSPTEYFVIAGAIVAASLAAAFLAPKRVAPRPPAEKPRRRTFRVHPDRLVASEGAAVEEAPAGLRLAPVEPNGTWSARIRLADGDGRTRVRFKPVRFSKHPTLQAILDGKPAFTLRAGKEGAIEMIPDRDGPALALAGDPRERSWELRREGRTIAAAEPGIAARPGGSAGDAAGGAPDGGYGIEVLSREDPLAAIAAAVGIEILSRGSSRN